jgi:hypothetical protein
LRRFLGATLRLVGVGGANDGGFVGTLVVGWGASPNWSCRNRGGRFVVVVGW